VGATSPALVLPGVVLAATLALAARSPIVRVAPATAAVYAALGLPVDVRGLSITDVRAEVQPQSEGEGELLVTGEIANLGAAQTPTPNLRLALRGEDGRELYVWTARGPKASLEARERVAFRARLASPPSGVREVLVKFVTPGDKGVFTESPS
jgi:hypothetical protein